MAIYYHKSLEQVGEEFVSSSSSGLFMRCSEVSSGPAIIWRVLLGPEDSFLRGAYSYGWEVDADEVNPLHVSFLSFLTTWWLDSPGASDLKDQTKGSRP